MLKYDLMYCLTFRTLYGADRIVFYQYKKKTKRMIINDIVLVHFIFYFLNLETF